MAMIFNYKQGPRRTDSLALLAAVSVAIGHTGLVHAFSVSSTTAFAPQSQRIDVSDESVQAIWGIRPNHAAFPGSGYALASPPVLEIPNFLSDEECEMIKKEAARLQREGTECDDYLNYRVNTEVKEKGSSAEGRALIEEQGLAEEELSAENGGGFRVRLDPSIVTSIFGDRLLHLLTFANEGKCGNFSGERSFVFNDGLWIRPTPRTCIVRDQTVVFYGNDDGVPPHIDGRDATLLVYLNDVPDGCGGRTVFPEDGFFQVPCKGTALLYRSKTELLHYSEAVNGAEKWIMQLLLDFEHDYSPGDTVTDFQTGTSYVWEG